MELTVVRRGYQIMTKMFCLGSSSMAATHRSYLTLLEQTVPRLAMSSRTYEYADFNWLTGSVGLVVLTG